MKCVMTCHAAARLDSRVNNVLSREANAKNGRCDESGRPMKQSGLHDRLRRGTNDLLMITLVRVFI